MELKCAFVLVLVNLVAAYGYGVKGGGAVAKAESSAVASSGIGDIPLSIPPGGGYSSSFSKSSSSSFASSSASSSSSSFSYSSSGNGGFIGTNGIPLSKKGDCVSGTCQDQSYGGINELNGSDTNVNGLNSYTGSAAGANAFAASSGHSQNADQIPCSGYECSTQGLTGSKSNSISGSSSYAQSGTQTPCTGEKCAKDNPITGAKTNSVSASLANAQTAPCVAENCSEKSKDCALGSCGSQLQTKPPSYAYEPKDVLVNANQGAKTELNLNYDNSEYKDSSVDSTNFKPENVYGTKNKLNNAKHATSNHDFSDQSKSYEKDSTSYSSVPGCTNSQCHSSPPYPQTKTTESLYPQSSYSTQSPKCISENCDQNVPKTQYAGTVGKASVPIPSSFLTTPNQMNHNTESLCTTPDCNSPETNYPGTENRPSSYNVPIYPVETTNPAFPSQETDVKCTSANCKNNYPYTDYTPTESNTAAFYPASLNINKATSDADTKDIEVPKSSSTSYPISHTPSVSGTPSTCLTGNCANNNIDKTKEPKLPSYLASLPSQPNKPVLSTFTGGASNCATGNCVSSLPSYPSSFVHTGTGTGNSGLPPPSSQTIPTLNCLGLKCAPYPLVQIKEPLPSKQPSYFFETPSFSNPHHASQPPKYSNTPYSIYQLPGLASTNPTHTHVTSQPSYYNQLPVSGSLHTGTSSLPSTISSSTPGISESSHKGSVFSGSFGGPSGLLTPNDYTIPANPLSPQQRPPVKPLYPYDGSLAPTSTTVNYPVSTSHKATCASGNCGSQPNLSSHYDHGASTSVISTNSETESKGVLYTGGFGGPPGVLAPYDSNAKSFAHSSATKKPIGAISNGPDTGNIHSSYSGFTSAKPNTDVSAVSNAFSGGYKSQENIGHNLQGGGSTGLNKGSSSYGGNTHYDFGNAFGLFMPSQSSTLTSHPVSGYGSQAITGSRAAANAGSVAYSGDTQQNGNTNKFPSACGNGKCSYHYGGTNSGLGLLDSGSSPNVGTGAVAGAQSSASSGFYGDNQSNGSHIKGGCGGSCTSNGANSDGGNDLYGTAAIAKSSATATSGAGTNQFGLGRSFASSSATAHASSGAAVKGSYGKR